MMQHPPAQMKKAKFAQTIGRGGGVVRAIRLVTSWLLVLLCVPCLLLLDILLFEFTRPGCAGCATFSGFLMKNSTTLAFLQANESVTQTLAIFRKII